MKRLRITVLVDDACLPERDPEYRAGISAGMTESHVVNALRDLDYPVTALAVGADPGEVVSRVRATRPGLVFNLTEEFMGVRHYDQHVASVLELMGVPFTGSGPSGLLLTRDKGLCKELLSHHRVHVPAFVVFPPDRPVRIPAGLTYPLVVKPACEDGSDGIALASLVRDAKALAERVRLVHARWRQAAVAEAYIPGRELYVGVLGNGRLRVLPPRELVFGSAEQGGPVLATGRVKFDKAYRESWNIRFQFAELDGDTLGRLERTCRRAYRILRVRDYGRIDLRIRPDGRIVILEVNANPDLAYGDELAEAAERAGITYEALIRRIVRSAMRRARA
jgi:D-alanine-D-alanine ligase